MGSLGVRLAEAARSYGRVEGVIGEWGIGWNHAKPGFRKLEPRGSDGLAGSGVGHALAHHGVAAVFFAFLIHDAQPELADQLQVRLRGGLRKRSEE